MKRLALLSVLIFITNPAFSLKIDDFVSDGILVVDERYSDDQTLIMKDVLFRIKDVHETVVKEYEDVSEVFGISGFPKAGKTVLIQSVKYTIVLEADGDGALFSFDCVQDRPANEKLRALGAKTTAFTCPSNFKFSLYDKNLRVINSPKNYRFIPTLSPPKKGSLTTSGPHPMAKMDFHPDS